MQKQERKTNSFDGRMCHVVRFNSVDAHPVCSAASSGVESRSSTGV